MTAPLLKTLDEIEGRDLPLVGGKAFNLATLRRHGLPVPPGLVVTTTFFEAQVQHQQYLPLWAGSPDVAVSEDALCWLADILKTTPLSRELMDALTVGLAKTFPEVESFAVRSSAIDEDTGQYTFSGVHLSELGVPRELVTVSLGRCWASALSKPALEYRRQHGIPIRSIRLAVLIQPFIQPAVAGVAFTVNPLSGVRDELVIEATFGHGSRVASGQVTPARYRLAKRPPAYPLLDWTSGENRPLSSPTEMSDDVPSTGENRGPLSTSQLQTLAQYLEQIEALMAAPQDVEWAITQNNHEDDDQFFFFQTRPITVLPGTAVPSDVEWSRAKFREFLPDLPSPMFISLLERTQDRALSFLTGLGFNVENSGPYLKPIYGRPYLNLTLARRLLGQTGVNPAGTLWVIGHTELTGDLSPTHTLDWRETWGARRAITRLLMRGLRARAELEHFERLADEVRRSLVATDWAKASPADLLTRFRLRTQVSSQMTEVDFVLIAATAAAFTVVARVIGFRTDEAAHYVQETLDTDVITSGVEQGRKLLELTKIARTDEQTRHYLSRPDNSFADYRGVLDGTPFLAAFDDFLAHYGGYAAFESDPGWPRHGEDPSPLLVTVAQMVNTVTLPDRPETNVSEQRPGQLSEFPGGGDQPWEGIPSTQSSEDLRSQRYRLAHPAIKRLQRLTEMRAQLRIAYGQSITDCRHWDLKLAQQWVARGWLTEPGDYFWLTMEEVERALMAETEVGPTLPVLVRARREIYQTYAATEMPYTLRESDVGRLAPGYGLLGTALSSVLSGLPVSPGQVQGRVIVLNRPEDSARMQEGAILVTPSTDTAWFPIFPQARGLIVETGGLLSHGSIIAREFGLPAVANIPDATSRFHDGDLVLLDGSTGLVQILDPATGGSS